MRLRKLILKKYTRLALNMIERFEYTPTAATQFILGTNGSGKSSLIHECSPLPPDKTEYGKDGGKFVSYEKDGIIYDMDCYNKDGEWHFSFIKDGVELNESHAITTQFDLVKRHFGYTPEMHALIIGEVKFTTMSTSEKRKWFTMLANSNFDYALGVFKRVSEKYNESRYSLKRAKERLVIEAAKVLPVDQIKLMESDCNALYEQVQSMIELRKPLMDDSLSYIHRSNRLAKELESKAALVRSLLLKVKRTLPKDIQALQEELYLARGKNEQLQKQSQIYFDDFERVQKLWESMQASKLENAAQINQQIQECYSAIEKAQNSIVLGIKLSASADTAIASCDKLLAWWPDVCEGFHNNSERGWGRDFLNDLNAKLDKTIYALGLLKQQIAKTEQTIEHHQAHQNEDLVNCPKCKHSFSPNFSIQTLEEAKAKLKVYEAQEQELTKTYEEQTQLKAKVENYFSHYRSCTAQLRNYPGLENFAEYVVTELILVNSHHTFTTLVNQMRDDAGHYSRIEQAQSRIKEIEHLAKELQSRGDFTTIDQDRERLERTIGECEMQKGLVGERIRFLQGQLSIIEQLRSLEETLDRGLADIGQLHKDALEATHREVFAGVLRQLQSELAAKEQALTNASRQQSVIEHLEREIEELTLDTKDYKLLQQELSPTEGLIAEGIFGFMTKAVDQMNQTVGMLFSYPLKIMPCSTEGDSLNLNYRFPIMVDGVKRKDVSKGSSAMHEVFNLAFVIMAMKACNMGTYPLFLDEFGKTMDSVHKQASIAMLGSLIDLEHFEQIFIISHSAIQYMGTGRSEICVLHEANVSLPPNTAYNKHVVIN